MRHQLITAYRRTKSAHRGTMPIRPVVMQGRQYQGPLHLRVVRLAFGAALLCLACLAGLWMGA